MKPPEMKPPGLLFRHRAYTAFWVTRLCATLANQMMMLAVGYQMYDLTHSAWNLGLVGLMQFAPALVLNLLVGQIVDRYDRCRILAGCFLLQGLVALLLVDATLTGQISREHILIAAIALGTAKAFQMPTQGAMPALLVPRDILPQALALNGASNKLAVILGPSSAGFIYLFGAHIVYAACATMLLAALACLTQVRYLIAQIKSRDPISWNTLFAGVRFIWVRKALLGANSLDLFATLLGGVTALLPIYARDILHTGSWGLGILRSGPALGAFCMSVWLARRPVQHRAGHTMFSAVAFYGLFIIAFGISTNFVFSLVMLAASGAADMLSSVIRQTLVQLETPDDMRGRVGAVNAIFIGASNQLGEFESGTTAALFGTEPAVVAGGIGSLVVAALWIRLFPQLAGRDTLQGGDSNMIGRVNDPRGEES